MTLLLVLRVLRQYSQRLRRQTKSKSSFGFNLAPTVVPDVSASRNKECTVALHTDNLCNIIATQERWSAAPSDFFLFTQLLEGFSRALDKNTQMCMFVHRYVCVRACFTAYSRDLFIEL